MGSISSSIELRDNFTGVLMNIINTVNMSVAAMGQMQAAMNEPVDTASLQGMRDQLAEATLATKELDAAMKGLSAPPALSRGTAPEWQPYRAPEVFTGVGMERFIQETADLDAMLERLHGTQQMVMEQAGATTVLSPQAANDILEAQNRLQALQDQISQVESNALGLGTDEANANLERLRGQLSQTVALQENLNQAMQGADIGEINDAYQRLSRNISDAERMVRDSFSNIQPVEIPVTWKTDTLEVFTGTGIERFAQEAASANAMLENLNRIQAQIAARASQTELFPPDMAADMERLQDRMLDIQNRIQSIENDPLDMGTDEANANLERLRGQLGQITSLQGNLNQAMQGADIGKINEAYLRLSRNISDAERMVRDSFSNIQPVEIPVTWKTDTLEVFTGTGLERFTQEAASANAMLETLNQTQLRIAASASQADILPPGMAADMEGLQGRLMAVQGRIQAIESNPLNIGTDVANAGLEQLRAQLNQAAQEQENLNQAVSDMDVQAANAAYLRLSQTVGNTEKYIRDNVDEQGQFNRAIGQGTGEADRLMQAIKGAVAAYASFQTLGNVLGMSDQLVSTTARLDMMNDGLQTTKELQDMIFLSAERSRGSYQSTADAVSKLGLMAGDAFSSSEEIIAFMEQVNKQFAIAGTEASGIDAAMLQLTQAMGSGVLRGEEYNSILDQAPNIIQSIAGYIEGNGDVLAAVAGAMDMEVADLAGNVQGHLKDIAGEGLISADMVKAAMFAAADETNAKFESMPQTFEQIWTSFENNAEKAFDPVLARLNEFANSEGFQTFINNAIDAISIVAGITLDIFDFLDTAAGVIADNWLWLSPIIYGVAAALAVYYGWQLAANAAGLVSKGIHVVMAGIQMIHAAATGTLTAATAAQIAAQNGLNTAMYACPVMWIIIAVIALIAIFYAAVAAVNHFAGTSVSATGVICGFFMSAAAFIGNLFVTLVNFAIDIFVTLWNFIAAFANFFGNVFNDPVGAIARLFFDLADVVLGILETLASAIDTVFGSNLAGAVSGWRGSLSGWVEDTFGRGTEVMEKMDASSMHIERFEYGKAWDTGYSFGQGIEEKVANFDPASLFEDNIPNPDAYTNMGNYPTVGTTAELEGIGSGIDDIAGNTGAIADAMDITQEELKYLRDLAEREFVNRYTVAEVNIDQSGMQNTIKNGMDLDGVVSGLTDAVFDAVDSITEGVHA